MDNEEMRTGVVITSLPCIEKNIKANLIHNRKFKQKLNPKIKYMGFFDTKFSANKKNWIAIANDDENSDEFKYIIMEFLIKDDIDIEKYLENQKANSLVYSFSSLEIWEKANSLSIYDDVKNQKINCTPTFRKHFASSKLNRGLGLPDWFYIGYPDVVNWINTNTNILISEMTERENEFITNGKPNPYFFRFLIDKYKKESHNKLECSII